MHSFLAARDHVSPERSAPVAREGAAHHVATLRFSALLIALGAVLSGPVAMLIVAMVAPQPAWTTASVFAEHFRPIQTLPYVLGFILLGGFVAFIAACHAVGGKRMRTRTSVALVATAVYATFVFANYVIQVGYVPHALIESPSAVAALTMSNPASFAWFLEMFGYAALGIATWLCASLFGGSPRATLIRSLLIANGPLSAVGAVCTARYDRWVFSQAGFASFAWWNAMIAVCFVLIAVSPNAGLREVREESD